MPGSDTCFLEVTANVSLKVAIKDYSIDKKTKKMEIFRLFV